MLTVTPIGLQNPEFFYIHNSPSLFLDFSSSFLVFFHFQLVSIINKYITYKYTLKKKKEKKILLCTCKPKKDDRSRSSRHWHNVHKLCINPSSNSGNKIQSSSRLFLCDSFLPPPIAVTTNHCYDP